ncbi:hypothetical protein [Mesorhizobium sp. LNHC209A00]|uniref:hypothetical protein n=1 Tax=Mesorhizobium sp. LNHC209A00 TaxID=1287226 RepID=UPI0012EC70B6|nr:hypothetical protein [Mesorhizobium sp. LNHC209A00]
MLGNGASGLCRNSIDKFAEMFWRSQSVFLLLALAASVCPDALCTSEGSAAISNEVGEDAPWVEGPASGPEK